MADRAAIKAGELDGNLIDASFALREACHGSFSLPPHLNAKEQEDASLESIAESE